MLKVSAIFTALALFAGLSAPPDVSAQPAQPSMTSSLLSFQCKPRFIGNGRGPCEGVVRATLMDAPRGLKQITFECEVTLVLWYQENREWAHELKFVSIEKQALPPFDGRKVSALLNLKTDVASPARTIDSVKVLEHTCSTSWTYLAQ